MYSICLIFMYKQQYVSTSSCWYVVYVSIYLYNIHTYVHVWAFRGICVEHMYVYEYGQRPSAHVHMGQKNIFCWMCEYKHIHTHVSAHIHTHVSTHVSIHASMHVSLQAHTHTFTAHRNNPWSLAPQFQPLGVSCFGAHISSKLSQSSCASDVSCGDWDWPKLICSKRPMKIRRGLIMIIE